MVPFAAPMAKAVRKKKNICHEATASLMDFQKESAGFGATMSNLETMNPAREMIPIWM
jgi:hypothetical protein